MSQGQGSRTTVAIFRSSPSSRLKQESLGTEDLGAGQFSEPSKIDQNEWFEWFELIIDLSLDGLSMLKTNIKQCQKQNGPLG